MIRRAWGNLTPFGREVALFGAVLVMAWSVAFGMGLEGYASASPDPTPARPMVLASSMVAVTTPVIDLGRIVSMDLGEVDGRRPVGSLSESQLRALATDVSGSPYWAAWATKCWGGEATRVEGGRYLVWSVSGVNPDGSRDYGIPQLNELWFFKPFYFDVIRVVTDPRYAVEIAWREVWPRQGARAWFGKGCGV